MDPILIGTAVSEHVTREMIKPAVQIDQSTVTNDNLINIHDLLRD